MFNQKILTTLPQEGYELLDSGENEKLERFGDVILCRPDPQALWPKNKSNKIWSETDAIFSSKSKSGWDFKRQIEKKWPISFGDLKFWIRPSTFKHVGIFPEQLENWNWMRKVIKEKGKSEKVKVLNLFGYTGGASLACAQAGAEVVHLDGSKVAINWARENAELSGLDDKPIRWIFDNTRVFLKREIKRGKKYDGIIMDPPAFGHGPDGELWKIEENFLELMDLCRQVLSESPLFFLINGYASGYSSIAYLNNLEKIFPDNKGQFEHGELALQEKSGRLLPAGIFARWTSN